MVRIMLSCSAFRDRGARRWEVNGGRGNGVKKGTRVLFHKVRIKELSQDVLRAGVEVVVARLLIDHVGARGATF
jgi:hypothetical protein